MLFVPPRCPHRQCAMHLDPQPGFYTRQGSYRPKCRREPIPRFQCSWCGKGFSRQTFRGDYRDRKPELNVPLFRLLVSGVGLRQCGRLLGLGVHSVQHKFRKIGRLLGLLNRNLLRRLPDRCTYLFDELESFEDKSICPLTVPVLIERSSKLVVATGVASIRRVAVRGSRKQKWLKLHEQEHGKRQDLGRACVHKVLRRFRTLLDGQPATLITDQKGLYAALSRRLFGDQVAHLKFSGKLARTTLNPLFPINHTEAMLRDNCGRLRRRSWLVSKRATCLLLQLQLFTAYRNWHRKRTNDDDDGRTPAVVLGVLPRQLDWSELLAWRQDWRLRSIHPGSASGQQTVLEMVA
jgi:transposase-like protein